jgi:MoaA/NifB/PqqE/SkfB family radical SAM enzyme
VERIRRLAPDLPIRARCTVNALNAHALQAVAYHAHSQGMLGLSFLAADHESPDSFGRAASIELEAPEPESLEGQIRALWADPGPPFITNSWESLNRIVEKARADRGGQSLQHPSCDAPWTSAVIQSDLSIRPCFFLEQTGDVRMGLREGLEQGRSRRKSLRLSEEQACARCVCWARLG